MSAGAEAIAERLFARDTDPPGAVALTQRRVYILPTRAGLAFGGVLALLLIGSINYNLSLGYLLTFLLAGLGLVGLLHTWRNLARLVVSPGRADPVFAGDEAVFTVRCENPSAHERIGVGVAAPTRTATRDAHARRSRGDRRRRGGRAPADSAETAQAAMPARASIDVPARGEAVARVRVLGTQRGWLALGRLTLDTTWPLGLWRAWAYVGSTQRVLVWPAPEADAPPPPASTLAAGDGHGRGPGTDDFAGLRTYADGDPLRHVAWKAFARSGVLATKQFDGQVTTRLDFTLDALPRELPLEAKLSRLAAWVIAAHAQDAEWRLRLPERELPMAGGVAHRDACLDALALHGRAAPTS